MSFYNLLVAIYISSSVLIILANLAIIFVILYSPVLRQRPRSMIMLSMAIADLLMGSFVTPMYTRNVVVSEIPDCHTHLALQVIGDHGIFFIVGWSLVTFNIIHIKKMSVRFPLKWLSLPISRCAKGVILAIWPWLAAITLLVPLLFNKTPIHLGFTPEDVMCMLRLPQSVLIIAEFLSLYLPFYLCVAALVTMVVCYSKGCHRQPSTTLMEDANASPSEETSSSDQQEEHTQEQVESQIQHWSSPQENPLVASGPNTVYLVCYMPLIVHTWLHISGILTPNGVYGVILFGLLARSFLLPATWLLFTDVNREVHEYWRQFKTNLVLCISNPPPTSSSSVSFSRLQETQTI